MDETRKVAEWIVNAKYGDFPKETIDYAKGLLLKTVTGMVIGSREPIGKTVTNYLSRTAGPPVAGVTGGGFCTTLEDAAYAHGVFAHASELEDDEFPPTGDAHGNYWSFPAILSLGEDLFSGGRELIVSAILSWEILSRLTRAACAKNVDGKMEYTMGNHTGISTASYNGTISATVAAARLMNLSVDQVQNALSLSVSHAAGKVAQLGFDAHFIESGNSCRTGVQSAIFARDGLKGRPDIFERPDGVFGPVWSEGMVDVEVMTKDLGKPPFLIHKVEIKKYGCCNLMHSTNDNLGMIIEEHDLKAEDVEQVEVGVTMVGDKFCNRAEPATPTEARFSYQFAAAEMLLRRKIDFSTFSEKRLADADIREVAKKVKVFTPEGWPPMGHPGSKIVVTLKDGKKIEQEIEAQLGHPKNPLTLEQITNVSRNFLGVYLSTGQCDLVEETMGTLEEQSDIRTMMDLLTYFHLK
jgi:2-methylcitrate dehydratase